MSLTPPEKIPHDDWIKVQRIEKDRLSKEEETKQAEGKARPILFAALAMHFKKILHSLFPETKSRVSIVDKQQFLDDLQAFKKMLQILGNEDQSRNPEFIQQLSELWHTLQDHCNILNLPTRKNLPEAVKIKEFVDAFGKFPPSEDHTLGYYLMEYVGAEWLPFPFMDMLRHLHDQYQKRPETSEITKWLTLINALISMLEG